MEACLANIRRLNGRLRAIVSQPSQPLYRPSTTSTSSSHSRLLEGCPVVVKDLFCTEELTTGCASLMLRDFRAGYNATVVDLLLDSGAHILGKTNMDEYGMGNDNVHSIHGPVLNPRYVDEERSAGGSSGGSAASVAAGFCHLALASDTGGSTRLPAAYCGVLGFKPSYGRLSRYGLIAYASSLDTVGLMANDMKLLNRAFNCLDHYDSNDPTSLLPERRQQLAELEMEAVKPDGGQLVIGVPVDYCPLELQQDSRMEWFNSFLKRLATVDGIELQQISLPHSRYSTAAYYLIASAEASSNLARYDGIRYGHRSKLDPIFQLIDASSSNQDIMKSISHEQIAQATAHTRDEGFGREVKRRILLGNYVLSAQQYDQFYLQAQKVRRLIQRDFNRVFRMPHLERVVMSTESDNSISAAGYTSSDDRSVKKIDFIITPVSANQQPPLLSELLSAADESSKKTDSYLTDIFTIPPSLAGLPCISIPIEGGQRSVQLIGQYGCDQFLLKAAKILHSGCF